MTYYKRSKIIGSNYTIGRNNHKAENYLGQKTIQDGS